jgi:hypothetical protein
LLSEISKGARRIGLAVGAALALVAISRSIETNTQEGMDEIGGDVIVTQRGASDIFGGFLSEPQLRSWRIEEVVSDSTASIGSPPPKAKVKRPDTGCSEKSDRIS